MLSLDYHKPGPNSTPMKILKLLKNDISQQLSDIFNVSFLTGQFHCSENSQSHTQKNNLRLVMRIIDQYPFYLVLKRLFKNSCTKDCLTFWISKI